MRQRRKAREKDAWLREVERKLGHRFRNRALLRAALTHPSAGGERQAFERLAFLGDAILTLIMSLHMYKSYPNFSPGGLTRLRASMVNRTTLAQAAMQLGFHTMLRLGKSMEPGGRGRPALLAETFEAVVAALFLDRGLGSVTKFLERHLVPLFRPDASLDPKSQLQNLLQGALKASPRYRLVQHWGPPHARRFEVEVAVKGEILGRGQGESRRAAEQAAARVALAYWGGNHHILRPSRARPHYFADFP
ncbi:MAG: ribonuclease III [Candidatus Methylomirabilales bacterium]